MRLLLITILNWVIATSSFAQVIWSGDIPVSWDNFKGLPQETLTHKALTNTSLQIQYNCNFRCFYYKIEAVFHEATSWVATPSDDLLEHERQHFNIQELFARKIRKYLWDAWHEGLKDAMIDAGVDLLTRECKRYQELYDAETDHSRNFRRQKAWSEKIRRDLELLSHFSGAELSKCRD